MAEFRGVEQQGIPTSIGYAAGAVLSSPRRSYLPGRPAWGSTGEDLGTCRRRRAADDSGRMEVPSGILVLSRFFIAVLLGLAIASCGSNDEGGVRVLTDDESGSEIELEAGEQFEIHLESNPSTGFTWELSAMTTPDLVDLDDKSYVGPDSDLIGAPGTEVFLFTAGDEAGGILRLEYIRSFEDASIPERVVEFIIRIDGAEWSPGQGSPSPASTAVADE